PQHGQRVGQVDQPGGRHDARLSPRGRPGVPARLRGGLAQRAGPGGRPPGTPRSARAAEAAPPGAGAGMAPIALAVRSTPSQPATCARTMSPTVTPDAPSTVVVPSTSGA